MKYAIALFVGAGSAQSYANYTGWHTYNDNLVDASGDKCSWYDANPEQCGAYDTEEFVAADACIACGGGFDASCTDGEGVDAGGDGCEWYIENQAYCGDFDTDDFEAEDQCCSCDGGKWEYGCTDGEGVDSAGDGCDWYAEDEGENCDGTWDTDEFKASEQCCWCDGGEWW